MIFITAKFQIKPEDADNSPQIPAAFTAATVRPFQLRFAEVPDAGELAAAVRETIPDDAYVDDVHGLPAWRRHLTARYAEEIRAELAG
ncbi:hypothetical protein AB0C29_48635, partial [Actinoplanes sp. NPDC048791]